MKYTSSSDEPPRSSLLTHPIRSRPRARTLTRPLRVGPTTRTPSPHNNSPAFLLPVSSRKKAVSGLLTKSSNGDAIMIPSVATHDSIPQPVRLATVILLGQAHQGEP